MRVILSGWCVVLVAVSLLAPISAIAGSAPASQPAGARPSDPTPGEQALQEQALQEQALQEQALQEQACVRHALAEDARLGTARNHAPETVPIAEAVGQYVAGMGRIDLRGCPAAFVEAFTRHRQAWQDAQPLLARHADQRGEMHDVFDRIRAGEDGAALTSAEAAIWSTWAEVERATSAAGVASP